MRFGVTGKDPAKSRAFYLGPHGVTLSFAHVCTVDGVSLNLNVTMLSAYTAQTLRDGVVGTMYRLTMRDATQVYPRCTLVKSSTRTPNAVGQVTLTVSGMDNGLDVFGVRGDF